MKPASPLKVGVCHAEAIVNAGLSALLAGIADIELRTGAAAGNEWADVVLTDYANAIERVRQCTPRGQRVMIVSHREREWDVRTALAAGVHAYVPQQCHAAELISALRALGAGRQYFSKELLARAAENMMPESFTLRESAVLKLLALGCSNKQIAHDLNIGIGTVKSHIQSLFSKLGVHARTQAVALATQRGIVSS